MPEGYAQCFSDAGGNLLAFYAADVSAGERKLIIGADLFDGVSLNIHFWMELKFSDEPTTT